MTLYYSWDLGMTSEIISRNIYTIVMPQKQDHVLSKSRSICSLIVTALQKTMIKNHPILLKVALSFSQYCRMFYEKYKRKLCNLYPFSLFRFPEGRPIV